MNIPNWYYTVTQKHLTKILGFAQVTIGVFALQAEDLFGKHGAKYVLVISGLLTAWRGFWLSQNAELKPNVDKSDSRVTT